MLVLVEFHFILSFFILLRIVKITYIAVKGPLAISEQDGRRIWFSTFAELSPKPVAYSSVWILFTIFHCFKTTTWLTEKACELILRSHDIIQGLLLHGLKFNGTSYSTSRSVNGISEWLNIRKLYIGKYSILISSSINL